MKIKYSKSLIFLLLTLFLLTYFIFASKRIYNGLITEYAGQKSILVLDRNDEIIILKPNKHGNYADFSSTIPDNLKSEILKKEDKYFYYHIGINPFSVARAIKDYILNDKKLSSSTITQQLVKILLKHEKDRTLKNKIIESFYSICLEAHSNKDKILQMYANSVFFGNGTQGINTASRLYFNLNPNELSVEQARILINSISNPSNKNPFKTMEPEADTIKNSKSNFQKTYNSETAFEFKNFTNPELLDNYNINAKPIKTTIDQNLTKNLRDILKKNLQILLKQDAGNGSIVVIKIPENELLAIIGSPDISINDYGYKINMATKPRPIGSTIKPFIYLKGFEKDLRPYTLVEDKEYKYTIESGYSFYPKNYDYEYRGIVDLHYALSNSLNVPTVKVLEYIGIDNFNNFLLNDLKFIPAQDLNNYQLGIALGELEMDLLSLSYYFSIFPNNGILKPLKLSQADNIKIEEILNTKNNFSQNKKISNPAFVQLVNKILSDRKTGVEQFGENSDLNLFSKDYAVKTGTSREYHDSWTVGYTPDFIVGVWVGNSDDSPMEKISGQSGAGKIWQEAMNLLLNTKYNSLSKFSFDLVEEYHDNNNIVYGLKGDDFKNYKNLLENNNLILNPHNEDTFLFEKNMQIPLKARDETEWLVNGEPVGNGRETIFQPQTTGKYKIESITEDKKEEVIIYIEN